MTGAQHPGAQLGVLLAGDVRDETPRLREHLAPDQPGRLDHRLPDVAAPLERAARRPEARAEAVLGHEDTRRRRPRRRLPARC
jgi:hypothetical protein